MKRFLALLLVVPLAACTTVVQTIKEIRDLEKEANGEEVVRGCPPATLGIETRTLTPAQRKTRSLPERLRGAQVTEVLDGSPVIGRGLWSGDVITAIDGDDITTDCDVADAIYDRDCDDEVKLTFWRQGELRTISVPVVDATSFYEKACKDGNSTACFRLGGQFKAGYGREKNEERAIELYREACDQASAAACSALAKLYLDKGAPHGWTEVIALSTKACEERDPQACTDLGFLYASGTGVTRDDAASMPWFRRACELGDPQGCYNVGLMLQQGRGVEQSTAAALAAYQEACDGGSAQACTNAGWLYERGDTVIAKDEQRAFDMFQRGCEGTSCTPSNANGCVNWGRAYRDGIGANRDPVKAAQIFEEVCNRTSDDDETRATIARSCSLLGSLVIDTDRDRALLLYRKGCDEKDTFGCFNLGVLESESDPTTAQKDFETACTQDDYEACFESGLLLDKAQLYDAALLTYAKACNNDEQRACVNLGILYADGHGADKDVEHAMKLFTDACAHDQATGCFNAGRHFDEGDGVTADRKHAKELFAKACELGMELACSRK